MKFTSTILVRAKPTKLSCDVAQPGPKAAGRFPSSKRLWRRVICTAVVLLLMTLCVQIGSAQTALLNGTNQSDTLVVNTTNAYTFTANAGDSIVLRLRTVSFDGALSLYGPNGVLLKTTLPNQEALKNTLHNNLTEETAHE
jgi:hypothetical protein